MSPTVSVDDATIQYTTAGEGPAIVFVPTGGFGAWQWSWQYPAFAGPFQAVTYHQRGTAQSPGSTAVGVDQYVTDLEAILTDAGIDRAHLVGYGLGGMIALEYAHRYKRARSLAVIATPSGDREQSQEWELAGAFGVSTDNPDQLRASTQRGFSSSFLTDQPAVCERIVQWRQAEDGDQQAWQNIETTWREYQRDWPLYEMQLPTLVIHGDSDQIVSPHNATQLADGLPRAEHRQYSAGHFVMIERATELNDALFGFYEEKLSSVPWES